MKLATRYFIAFAAVVTTALVVIGGVDAVSAYTRGLSQVGELQRAGVRIVATRIAAYLETVSMQLAEVNALPWARGVLTEQDRRSEMHRLLKLNPAIHELRVIGSNGGIRDVVSRTVLDRALGTDVWRLHDAYVRDGARPTWYGPVYFREGSTPYVSLAVRNAAVPGADVLVAEIDLRYVTELIASMRFADDARAYVIDGADRLIAHPNLSLLHRNVSLAGSPQVIEARKHRGAGDLVTTESHSPETNAHVLTSAALIAGPPWVVFVEQPFSEIMAPVWAMIYRTLGVLIVLLALGLIVSRWLADKLTRPIVALERGAARITSGDLSVRVETARADEIGALASEFNRMAASLGRSHAELESLVTMRTVELADANRKVRLQADEVASLNRELELRLLELAIKKEEAERANAAKTRFLAAASHDLRQPMQAISLLMEVLRERITGHELRVLAEKVQGSVNALETLFVSLLDISRLDAGVIKPQWQDFRIEPLLSLLQANFLPQALAKGLKFTVVRSSCAVHSDAALLERILSNLVSNAIRYTQSGRVVVGCRRRDDALRIVVVDTGPGIPSHLHDEIFEEFFQVSNPERDRTKGLGLGLSIVKRTAGILGHSLVLRSEPGRGSMFGVDVPLARVAPVQGGAPFPLLDRHRLQGTFVVIIDDDRENRFAIEALCAQWGCHVLGAPSGEVAITELERHLRGPDLIITDYRLRDGEIGTSAVMRIRDLVEEQVPAIVITGDMSVRASHVASYGRTALLHKPINAEKLWSSADALLSARPELSSPSVK